MKRARGSGGVISGVQAAALAAVLVATGLPLAALLSNGPDRVLLIVQPELYGAVSSALGRYSRELRADGYGVGIVVERWADAAGMRDYIAGYWRDNGLAGCIMLGSLPTALYEMRRDPTIGGRDSVFPIDLYFEDLDGAWLDGDSNGVLDAHEAGSGDLRPERGLGRLALQTGEASEADLINAYLERDGAYRRGEAEFARGALLYLDDDWTKDLFTYEHGLSLAYDRTKVVCGMRVTNASDYAGWLDDGYEWVQVHTHSSADRGAHVFAMRDGADNDRDGKIDEPDEGGAFGAEQIRDMNPASAFYNVFTCAAANYTRPDYLCGWYALGGTHGLCAIGSTKAGAMLNFDAFYGPLGKGATVGEAFKEWMSGTAEEFFGFDVRNVSRGWFYGMTVIGDPTLSLVRHDPQGAAAVAPDAVAAPRLAPLARDEYI
jgi:hypothetical protein